MMRTLAAKVGDQWQTGRDRRLSPQLSPVPGSVRTVDSAGRFRILFVCTANACRSVIAERLAAEGLRTRLGTRAALFEVASAGTAGVDGAALHPYTATALRGFGVAADDFTSRRLTTTDVGSADLVLTAGSEHREQVVGMWPRVSRRAYLLREFRRLAAQASAPPSEDPVARARHVVAEAARLRGRVPYVEPAEDEIADPRPTHADFVSCAEVINAVLRDVLDVLCGNPPQSACG
jgi:protein-tyrosine phosphatase